jgi:hypothetical protein
MAEPPHWDPGLKALGAQNLQECTGKGNPSCRKNLSTKGSGEAYRTSSPEFPNAAKWVKPSSMLLGGASLRLRVETLEVPRGLGTSRHVTRQTHLIRPPISDMM